MSSCSGPHSRLSIMISRAKAKEGTERKLTAPVLRPPPSRHTCTRARTSPQGAWMATSVSGSRARSEEHTSELQSLMRISYAVFCLTKQTTKTNHINNTIEQVVFVQKSITLYNQ